MSIETAVVSAGAALVSKLQGILIEGVLKKLTGGQGDQTLQSFLNTFATNLSQTVALQIESAFEAKTFQELSTQLFVTTTSFRTYQETNKPSDLESASKAVVLARSILQTACDKTLAQDPKTSLKIADRKNRADWVLQHNRTLEASMTTLQVVATLDVAVGTEVAKETPGMWKELAKRIAEYISLGEKLRESYLANQPYRAWEEWDREDFPPPPRPGGLPNAIWLRSKFICLRIVDGKETERQQQLNTLYLPDDLKKYSEAFRKHWTDFYAADKTLHEQGLKLVDGDVGNISTAIKTWRSMKEAIG